MSKIGNPMQGGYINYQKSFLSTLKIPKLTPKTMEDLKKLKLENNKEELDIYIYKLYIQQIVKISKKLY